MIANPNPRYPLLNKTKRLFLELFGNGRVESVMDCIKPILTISRMGFMSTVKKNKQQANYELSVVWMVLVFVVVGATCLHLFLVPGTILYIEKVTLIRLIT